MRQSLIRLTVLALLTCASWAATAQTRSDLVVVDIIPFTYVDGEGVELTTVAPGTPVFFDFYILNQGNGPVVTSSYRLSVYVDSSQVPLERGQISQTNGDPPGKKHGDIATTNPWFAVNGTHTFRFVVDDTNVEPELDESNNTTLFTLTVGSAASFRATIAPNPVNLAPGATQNVTVTTVADPGFSGTITYSFTGFPAGISTGGSKAVTSPYPEATFSFSAQGVAPGTYNGQLSASSGGGTQTFALAVVVQAGTATGTLIVPIVLDVTTAIAHFTTELTLTNRGTTPVTLSITYTGSIEGAGGSGSTSDSVAAGAQVVIPNGIAYLRQRGVGSSISGNQGGTLRVQFSGASSADAVAVSARTTTATAAPQPVGSAGLAYAAIPATAGLTGSAVVYGLRSNDQDRSNLALFNPTASPVTVRVTTFSGSENGVRRVAGDSAEAISAVPAAPPHGRAGDSAEAISAVPAAPPHGRAGDSAEAISAVPKAPQVVYTETLPPLGWLQYSGILATAGLTNGWVLIEKTGGDGGFGAYGVVNDNGTSDGSFVLPVLLPVTQVRLTVPVLVETPTFRSELVLLNLGASAVTVTLTYRESLTPALGAGGSTTIALAAGQQLLLPEAIDALRARGIAIGALGAASYAGALRVEVSGGGQLFAGARTAARSPAGGQFGLFTPGVYAGAEASSQAFLYGLRADATNRSNVAVENAGDASAGPITLELRAYDGAAGGLERGTPRLVTLAAGEWTQVDGFLATQGVQNGWVRVTRLSGTAPWIAYGVINDGGAPGERTGDGAFIPMGIP